MKTLTPALAALLCAVAMPALANPNTSGTPLYGTHSLEAGFTPDPKEITVSAGGDTAVSSMSLPSNCTGHIVTSQPDVRLNWTAGSSALRIAVCSSADTSLIINDSSGNWHCDDDTEGTNPVVTMDSPPAGQYDIWVGTYEDGNPQSAALTISERSGTLCQ